MGKLFSDGPLTSRANALGCISCEFSLCNDADRGDAERGEYWSATRGEFSPERECVAGDVDFEGYDGPEGSRAGPIGGLDSDRYWLPGKTSD